MASKRTKSYIIAFRFQSALIAVAAGIMGVKSLMEGGHIDLLIACLIILVLKVIYIPNLLHKTDAKVEYKVEKDFISNIPLLVAMSCVLVVFTYFSVSRVTGTGNGAFNILLVNSISTILIGLFFMISRKKAIGQMIGYLVIENGLYITAMFATDGMPFIVDLGITIDLITAVMVMGIMVFRINEKFESVNLEKLKNLKG
jgi:hydrogenase-4 component E